jgi:hypothetical protein
MGKKKRAQTRLDPDTKQRVDDYCREKGLSESEAVRRLVERGLVDEGYVETAPGARGSVRDEIQELNGRLASVRRSIAGLFVAVVYTATAVVAPTLAPSGFPVNAALSAVGLLLIVVLSLFDVIDITGAASAFRPSSSSNSSGEPNGDT